jgi:hypothetical protein
MLHFTVQTEKVRWRAFGVATGLCRCQAAIGSLLVFQCDRRPWAFDQNPAMMGSGHNQESDDHG